MTSVFAKRREGDEWIYGAIRPGEGIDAFRPGPHCATCHKAVSDKDGMFTGDMLRDFVSGGKLQNAYCDLPGRSPCDADTYRARASVIRR